MEATDEAIFSHLYLSSDLKFSHSLCFSYFIPSSSQLESMVEHIVLELKLLTFSASFIMQTSITTWTTYRDLNDDKLTVCSCCLNIAFESSNFFCAYKPSPPFQLAGRSNREHHHIDNKAFILLSPNQTRGPSE